MLLLSSQSPFINSAVELGGMHTIPLKIDVHEQK